MHHHGYTELLPHVGIKRVRYFWGKNRGKWKGRQPPGIESRTPASALQLSYDDQSTNQPSQCSTYTAQVGLKCLSLTPGNHSVCAVRSQKLFLPQKHLTLFIPTWGKSSVHLDWENHSACIISWRREFFWPTSDGVVDQCVMLWSLWKEVRITWPIMSWCQATSIISQNVVKKFSVYQR